jgi:hypothetical protein
MDRERNVTYVDLPGKHSGASTSTLRKRPQTSCARSAARVFPVWRSVSPIMLGVTLNREADPYL